MSVGKEYNESKRVCEFLKISFKILDYSNKTTANYIGLDGIQLFPWEDLSGSLSLFQRVGFGCNILRKRA